LRRPSAALGALLVALAPCCYYGKAEYARDQLEQERRTACWPRVCDVGEMCNRGYGTNPCLPEFSAKLGDPCSEPTNCAHGLVCEHTGKFPSRCIAEREFFRLHPELLPAAVDGGADGDR
jgi:hypothetical protein